MHWKLLWVQKVDVGDTLRHYDPMDRAPQENVQSEPQARRQGLVMTG